MILWHDLTTMFIIGFAFVFGVWAGREWWR